MANSQEYRSKWVVKSYAVQEFFKQNSRSVKALRLKWMVRQDMFDQY